MSELHLSPGQEVYLRARARDGRAPLTRVYRGQAVLIAHDWEAHEDGDVYFIREKDPPHFVKIGVSKDVNQRLQRMQTDNPHEPEILCVFKGGDYHLEAALHDFFAAFHVRGEWYDIPERSMRKFLETAQQEASPIIWIDFHAE